MNWKKERQFPEEKIPETISLNYHEAFMSRHLENPAIIQDVSVDFNESNHQKIKTSRLGWVKEFPMLKFFFEILQNLLLILLFCPEFSQDSSWKKLG